MKRNSNLKLILFFTLLTFVMTTVVVFSWEKFIRDRFFSWVEAQYPGEDNTEERRNIQQRVEHFTISVTVDIVVVTLLLRLVGRQQRKLEESQERYHALFAHASDGIGVLSAKDFLLIEANNKFCQILGCQIHELVGHDVHELLRESINEIKSKDLSESDDSTISIEGEVLQMSSGAILPVSISCSPLSTAKEKLLILLIRDLSASKRLEAEKEEIRNQLFQTSKLASIGELSAGVAHEINNPLNGIINFAQLLKDDDAGRNQFEKQLIDGILDEGGRIAKIVHGLLTFARDNLHEVRPVQIAEAINTSVALFGRRFDSDDISLEIDLQDGLPQIEADASRLRQVVVNMMSNAHYALQNKRFATGERKVFRISAEGVLKDGGPVVRVEFYDNGMGIRPADLVKIYDPFFTTRRDTGGTGLGLSISFGIVRDHGGQIRVESRENCYTRFIVELPAIDTPEVAHV